MDCRGGCKRTRNLPGKDGRSLGGIVKNECRSLVDGACVRSMLGLAHVLTGVNSPRTKTAVEVEFVQKI